MRSSDVHILSGAMAGPTAHVKLQTAENWFVRNWKILFGGCWWLPGDLWWLTYCNSGLQ